MKTLCTFVFLFSAFAARAEVVDLNCTLPDGKKAYGWRVRLDETAGRISYEIPELKVVHSAKAVFSPNKVVFGRTIEIDRNDLTMRRLEDFRGPSKDTGKCELAKPSKRAF